LPQAVRPASSANVSANVGAKCDTRFVIFSQRRGFYIQLFTIVALSPRAIDISVFVRISLIPTVFTIY
jgi:hypothetical protein